MSQSVLLNLGPVRLRRKVEPSRAIEQNRNAELASVRQRLQATNPTERYILDTYWAESASEALFTISGEDKPDWIAWLAQESSNDQLMQFLDWHVKQLEKKQLDPRFESEIERQRAKFKATVMDGLDSKWLHPNAEAAIDKIDGIQVYRGDIFDTIMQERGGYHARGSNHFVITDTADPRNILGQAQIQSTFFHESGHAAIGRFPYRFLDEAATEHNARSLLGGSPEVLRPDARVLLRLPEGVYATERTFGADLLSQGGIAIPATDMTIAYSAGDPNHIVVKDFIQKINHSWAKHVGQEGRSNADMMDKINDHIIDMEIAFQEQQGQTLSRSRESALKLTAHRFFNQPELIFSSKRSFWQLAS